jgi:uncharacterized spore protein YtfJ
MNKIHIIPLEQMHIQSKWMDLIKDVVKEIHLLQDKKVKYPYSLDHWNEMEAWLISKYNEYMDELLMNHINIDNLI